MNNTLLLSREDYEEHSGRSFEEDYAPCRKRCAYCGDPNPTGKDHIIPKSRGGSNDKSNLVWCCVICNSRKGARTPEEAEMIILFVEESSVD